MFHPKNGQDQDQDFLLSASEDATIRIWDSLSGDLLHMKLLIIDYFLIWIASQAISCTFCDLRLKALEALI